MYSCIHQSVGKNIHKSRYLTTIYKVIWVLSKPKELKQSVMEELGRICSEVSTSGSTNHSSTCWPPPGFVDGGLDWFVNTPEGHQVRIPFNLPPPLRFVLDTRASDSSPLVLTCHMQPLPLGLFPTVNHPPHPIPPPACSDRWTTGRRHIAAPVLPVKQGDFDWPEGPQHQCSILTNPSPHAGPSQAVIVQNSRISLSILM